jgi:hypothetical protein
VSFDLSITIRKDAMPNTAGDEEGIGRYEKGSVVVDARPPAAFTGLQLFRGQVTRAMKIVPRRSLGIL